MIDYCNLERVYALSEKLTRTNCQTEFSGFLKIVPHCPGGAGRYRAEALQELAAQFGQTFGLQ